MFTDKEIRKEFRENSEAWISWNEETNLPDVDWMDKNSVQIDGDITLRQLRMLVFLMERPR